MNVTLGIDLGTSSVKVIAIDEDGKVIASAGQGYELSRPQTGWCEVDPQQWWQAARDTVREVVATLTSVGYATSEVTGIGMTGQMHSVVLVDGEGNAARKAMMWNDTRTATMVGPAREALRAARETYNASIVSTGSPALSLAWVRRHEPETFRRVKTFVIGPDWITYRLTGKLGTDWCMASTTSLFDVADKQWSAASCAALGIPCALLPQVEPSCQVVGTVLPEVACELALPGGVVVLRGTGDNPAAAIPTGCLSEGRIVLSLGTSGVLTYRGATATGLEHGKAILVSLDGADPVVLVQGVVQSCGEAYAWWCEQIMHVSLAEASADIDPAKPEVGELYFYPHLSGDKTLYADPTLRGCFIGLAAETTRTQMTLAVMQGISFAFRQLIEGCGLDLEREDALRVTGGGSSSDVWVQVLADTLGCPLERMRGEIGAGFGAAMLAQACTSGTDVAEISRGLTRRTDLFVPNPALREPYDSAYRRYLTIHDAVKSIYADI